MQEVTIYHNPKCSKSRQTLELLCSRAIEPKIILYLVNPPSFNELKEIVQQLGFNSPRQLMRQSEALYHELQLANPDLTETQLINAMLANPRLIERPIVISQKGVRIGRPPEQIFDII